MEAISFIIWTNKRKQKKERKRSDVSKECCLLNLVWALILWCTLSYLIIHMNFDLIKPKTVYIVWASSSMFWKPVIWMNNQNIARKCLHVGETNSYFAFIRLFYFFKIKIKFVCLFCVIPIIFEYTWICCYSYSYKPKYFHRS